MEKSKRPRKNALDKIKDAVIGKESEQELPPIQNDASGQPSFSSLLARQREVRKAKALKLKAKADESA